MTAGAKGGGGSSSSALVSVVIPTHDRSRLLAMTLRSALRQREVDLEVVVVDDGSTDDTAAVVRSAADPRVRLLRHDSARGVSAARNSGIEDARGRWIAFLDDDDLWAPDKLVRQLTAAASAGSAWVYTGAVKIDGTGRIVGGSPPPTPAAVMARLPRWSVVPGGCSGVIATRAALERTGTFDDRLVNLADWDLWIRLAGIGPPASSELPLVGYRLHPGQSSLDTELILREVALLETKHGMTVDRGELHHYLAHKCLLAGARKQAAGHFARAVMRGQVREVAAAGWSLAGGRVRRGVRSEPRRHPHAGWREQAAPWVTELAAMDAAREP